MTAIRKLWSDPAFLAAIQNGPDAVATPAPMQIEPALSAGPTATPTASWPRLKEITIEPHVALTGLFVDFTATGIYSDGSTTDITKLVTWDSPNKEFFATFDERGSMEMGDQEGNMDLSATL